MKSTTESDTYYSVSKEMSVKFVRSVTQSSGLTPYLEYTFYSVQPGALPTLKIEDFLGLYNDFNGDKSKYLFPASTEAYEATKGSTVNTRYTKAGRMVYDTKSPNLIRFYAYSNTTSIVNTVSSVLDKIDYVFFKDRLGNMVFTREFKELMAANGFENTVKEPDLFIFINSTRKMKLTIFYQKMEFFPNEPHVGIQVKLL